MQTAFLGDVILTLPLIQVLKREFKDAEVDVVATPEGAGLLANHAAIHRVIQFDKRGKDGGIAGFLRLGKMIKSAGYELAVVPHRSIRSALLVRLSNIPVTIGFDKSAGRWLFSSVVRYRSDMHEIERNLSLLGPLALANPGRELPSLYPSDEDKTVIEKLFEESGIDPMRKLIAIAPGTVWNTKRWLKERFAEVAQRLIEEGCTVVLIGGRTDHALCEEIMVLANKKDIVNTAGALTLLQSAELIRRCRVIVSNDSAPMHMGVAVHTPVIAIFGATVPSFGFAPYGDHDVVVEILGLACRPCSIHGGATCPIKTFVCMKNIDVSRVLARIHERM